MKTEIIESNLLNHEIRIEALEKRLCEKGDSKTSLIDVCERDTDGDADCHLCWNKGGCEQYHKEGNMCALQQWDQVDRWYYQNCSIWNSITKMSKANRMKTEDRLKVLSSSLMRRVIELERIVSTGTIPLGNSKT